MKKATRKALLTAKLYRPGKAGGGAQGNQDINQEFDPEEKYNGYISQIKFLPTYAVKHSGVSGEVKSVSEDVAKNMDYSQPIEATAFRYGEDNDENSPEVNISDGHHRLAAAKQTGRAHLPVKIYARNAKGKKLNALVRLSQQIEKSKNEDDINKAAGGRTGYGTGGTPKLNTMGFYSKAAQVARSLPQKKASGAQLIAMLADPKRGVKRDELINAGLLTREGKPNKWQDRIIASDDLADYLERSVPQLGETGYADVQKYPYKTYDEWMRAISEAPNDHEANEIHNAWMQSEGVPPIRWSGPKYKPYTLPGGNNYREVLLHLPVKSNGPKDNFKSSHWEIPNVLAHLRMKDRTGPNGEKVLHVEEIQSDWGQKGRDEGFYDPERTFEVYDWDKGKVLSQHATEEEAHAAADALPPDTPLNIRLAHTGNQPVAPVAPYVTSTEGWTDLALKRAMQEAVKGGYDKLVISPGQANADLYSLTKQIEALSYDPDQRQLSFKKKNGSWDYVDGEVKPEDLHKHIGKDYANALMATKPHPLSENHILENIDTKLGGEGMRKYYDRDVPQRLQKLVGSMDPDAKVRLHDFALPAGWDAPEGTNEYGGHSLDITDKMRAAVQQGLPAFKQGGMAGDEGDNDTTAQDAADHIAFLLREGRAKEVTDDLMDQADPKRLYEHYESGNTGMKLPMDEASRMERAASMGLPQKAYHATGASFSRFTPSAVGRHGKGIYTGKNAPDVQDFLPRSYDEEGLRVFEKGAQMLPVHIPAESSFAGEMKWQDALPDRWAHGDPKNVEDAIAGYAEAAKNLEKMGHKGVKQAGTDWDGRVVFNPAHIRSQFARFDPRLSHLSHLNAATGGTISEKANGGDVNRHLVNSSNSMLNKAMSLARNLTRR